LHEEAPAWSWNVLFGHGRQACEKAIIPTEKVPAEHGTHCTYVSERDRFATASTSYWISVAGQVFPLLLLFGYSPAGRAVDEPKAFPSQKTSSTVGTSRRNTPPCPRNRCVFLLLPGR
jgi:hypothetical protein